MMTGCVAVKADLPVPALFTDLLLGRPLPVRTLLRWGARVPEERSPKGNEAQLLDSELRGVIDRPFTK
jgi:hypothetical protein